MLKAHEKNPKGTNYWRNRVLKVGKEFSGYNFAISNKDDFMNELSEFGFDHTSGDKPVVAARDAKGLKYKMTAEFDMDSFKDFLTQLEAGNVEPWIKSEPVPDNSGAGVKVAVAKNFDELVTKSEKDVLVTSSSKFLATATLTPAPELSGTGSDLIHGSTLPASSWVRKSLKDSISNSAVILYLRPLASLAATNGLSPEVWSKPNSDNSFMKSSLLLIAKLYPENSFPTFRTLFLQ